MIIKNESKAQLADVDVNAALLPLLKKVQDYLKQHFPNTPTAITVDDANINDRDEDKYGHCDGACLSITYSADVTYKLLGSEWHASNEVAYLNFVRVEDIYTKAYRGELIERAEVDGSEDLEAEFMDWYDWAEGIAIELVQGNTY